MYTITRGITIATCVPLENEADLVRDVDHSDQCLIKSSCKNEIISPLYCYSKSASVTFDASIGLSCSPWEKLGVTGVAIPDPSSARNRTRCRWSWADVNGRADQSGPGPGTYLRELRNDGEAD